MLILQCLIVSEFSLVIIIPQCLIASVFSLAIIILQCLIISEFSFGNNYTAMSYCIRVFFLKLAIIILQYLNYCIRVFFSNAYTAMSY